MMIDQLVRAIERTGNPTVAGLDTHVDYLPPGMWDSRKETASAAVLAYNRGMLDALSGLVPAVKIQIAYYELLGLSGMDAFAKTCAYAKQRGFIVITDAKRGDIGATAGAYAAAHLGEGGDFTLADMLTVNPYFGSEGISPFLDACRQYDKGVFVLVKTSNPTSGELQDLLLQDGRTVYEAVADLVLAWGRESIGACGFSRVGAVVGATYPAQGARLRQRLPHTFFLVPGYGAQGAQAKDLAGCFIGARGAIVNASRSLLLAYRNPKHALPDYQEAARAEATRMRDEIMAAL